MEDRRIFTRFKAKVHARVLNLYKNEEAEATTSDFSAKGVGLETDREIVAHTPVELWLDIPDKGAPLYARGEVVWANRTPENTFRVGVNLDSANMFGLSRLMRIRSS